MSKHLFIVLVSLSACADTPSGDAHRIISRVGKRGTVTALFATQQANEQYCVYQNELAASILQRDSASAFAFKTATLLTPNSVSKSSLVEALRLESGYMSRAYNTATSALYPLMLCGGSLVSLPILRKKLMPASIALLSCGATALFIRKATVAQAEGEKVARTSVELLLTDGTHDNDTAVRQLPRVLPWLVTENALPCPSAKKVQGEATK